MENVQAAYMHCCNHGRVGHNTMQVRVITIFMQVKLHNILTLCWINTEKNGISREIFPKMKVRLESFSTRILSLFVYSACEVNECQPLATRQRYARHYIRDNVHENSRVPRAMGKESLNNIPVCSRSWVPSV